MTRTITVAALQLPLPGPVEPNSDAVSALVEEAAAKGAQVILPPELVEGPYFCQVEDEELFASARPTAEHPSVIAMQALAARSRERCRWPQCRWRVWPLSPASPTDRKSTRLNSSH